MKVRDLLLLLRSDGWILVRTRGSHRQYKHPRKAGLVTLAGHPSDDLSLKAERSILRQANVQPPAKP